MVARHSPRNWQKHKWEGYIEKVLAIAAISETILTRPIAKADKVETRLSNLETLTDSRPSEYRYEGVTLGSVVAKAPEQDLSRRTNRRSILH